MHNDKQPNLLPDTDEVLTLEVLAQCMSCRVTECIGLLSFTGETVDAVDRSCECGATLWAILLEGKGIAGEQN